jgi:flagella basal body P-ring formation protein FlgA
MKITISRVMNNFIKLLPWFLCFDLVHADQTELAQKAEHIKVQATTFVRSKIGPSNDLQVSIEGFEQQGNGSPCQHSEFFIPGQLTTLRGFVRIGLRCNKSPARVFYGRANITEAQTVYTLKTDLPNGHILTADNITAAKVFQKIPTMDHRTMTQQFVGRTLVTALPAGTALHYGHTKTSWVIKGGETVVLHSQGRAFRISLEGQAIGNAVAGQSIKVRTNTGRILNGLVLPEGAVELIR